MTTNLSETYLEPFYRIRMNWMFLPELNVFHDIFNARKFQLILIYMTSCGDKNDERAYAIHARGLLQRREGIGRAQIKAAWLLPTAPSSVYIGCKTFQLLRILL